MPLVDMAKKTEKARDKLGIPVTEQILAGCTTNPKGHIKYGVIGGAVGAGLAAREHERAATDGLATRFAFGRNALVMTDTRLLLIKLSALGGAPKEIVAEWPRADVTEITVDDARLTHPMSIRFSDGSVVEFEGAKGSNPHSMRL